MTLHAMFYCEFTGRNLLSSIYVSINATRIQSPSSIDTSHIVKTQNRSSIYNDSSIALLTISQIILFATQPFVSYRTIILLQYKIIDILHLSIGSIHCIDCASFRDSFHTNHSGTRSTQLAKIKHRSTIEQPCLETCLGF